MSRSIIRISHSSGAPEPKIWASKAAVSWRWWWNLWVSKQTCFAWPVSKGPPLTTLKERGHLQRVCQWFASRYAETCNKSGFWQQMKKKANKHQELFSEDGLYFWRHPPPSWRQNPFCRKRRFQHIWPQITGTQRLIAAGIAENYSMRESSASKPRFR